MKLLKNQNGIAHLAVLVIISAVAIGFVGWASWNAWQANKKEYGATTYQSKKAEQKEETKPDPYAGWETKYFSAANVSFRHKEEWVYDDQAAKPGFYANDPDLRSVALSRNFSSTRHGIRFSVNSKDERPEPNLVSFKLLGEGQLGSQTFYILLGRYDETVANMDKILISSCKDNQCSIKLPDSNPYFFVSSTAGTQNIAKMNEAAIGEIVKILQSLRIGR